MKQSTKVIVGIALMLVFGVATPFAAGTDSTLYQTGNLSPDGSCNTFTFDASKSYDPDNSALSYRWDFGDGTASTESIVTHQYQKSGDYDVTLTVADDTSLSCSMSVTRQRIRANIPPVATFAAPTIACVNETVTFDGIGSYDDASTNLTYRWDFGDGSTQQGNKTVSKKYTQGGDYLVSLNVDDNSQTVCSENRFEKRIYVNEPPQAEAGDETLLKCVNSPAELLVNFDASRSKDANGNDLDYFWDFGDGNTSRGIQTSHQYQNFGKYDAKLILKDGSTLGCGTGVDFVTVQLDRMPIAEAGEKICGCSGENIVFDGTQSQFDFEKNIKAVWEFGDGKTAQGLKVTHAYVSPGKYDAVLTLNHTQNAQCKPSSDTRPVDINSPPKASIKATSSGCVGDIIEFEAIANDPDGDELEYYWNFGDGGATKNGTKVSYQYDHGGTYKVSLIVDDKKGCSCSSVTATAQIKINTPPIADPGPNLACCIATPTEFNASASSDPDRETLTYAWEFGDGSTASGATTSHAYQKGGSYDVLLTVDDNSGTSCSSSSAGFTAEVNSAPVAVINVQ